MINNKETILLFITEASLEDQNYARATENKYSQLLISTITHDLKSPLIILQENLFSLANHVDRDGMSYYDILKIEAKYFEYYIYDLVVIFKVIYRIIIRFLRITSYLLTKKLILWKLLMSSILL